ncbi:hypothetical protein GGR50DRAFT_690597 [Xylaria sp. CBS 124048]|nr:hypothetical protein GGR50DRAFT_690597 [Xylaria sp. CBS 124048]
MTTSSTRHEVETCKINGMVGIGTVPALLTSYYLDRLRRSRINMIRGILERHPTLKRRIEPKEFWEKGFLVTAKLSIQEPAQAPPWPPISVCPPTTRAPAEPAPPATVAIRSMKEIALWATTSNIKRSLDQTNNLGVDETVLQHEEGIVVPKEHWDTVLKLILAQSMTTALWSTWLWLNL